MSKQNIRYLQNDSTDEGNLQINVETPSGRLPIENAKIAISFTGEPDRQIEQAVTNSSGQTAQIGLRTPPLEYSMEPSEQQPYAEYTIQVTAEGFIPVNVSGIQVLPGETAVQRVRLVPQESDINPVDNIVIPANTLFGNFPPKIPEDEIKPLEESGEIVLSRVVVPEYIVVHDGAPSDSTARDYYVTYKDYVKNVASSEIYATWPDATLRANILAIMSFTLNRVYTEWYRNKGYDFTITSSTAFDHKWIYGRNIFQNISRIVDDIFQNYLSRPNVKQPILTQYCDGQRVSCPNWMSQWGSKDLGDQGYSFIEILRYYYGSDMYVNEADEIAGIPSSWPREDLTIGSRGEKVRQMQSQLVRIARAHPAIPVIAADGIYGPRTAEAVEIFQSIFGLPVTGVVDYATWYKISEIYVGVTRIAELF